MNVSSYIARRYFFSKSSRNAVNIISGISILGILVGTAALIIVLSAFNGLETLVGSFYDTFDPSLKIETTEGKYFEAEKEKIEALQQVDGVNAISQVLEDRVLLNFAQKEYIATLKGVDENYLSVNPMDRAVRSGEFNLGDEKVPSAVLGAGVSYFLGYGRLALGEPIEIYVPRPGASAANFSSAFSSATLVPRGIFQVQPEFDEKYLISSLNFARKFLRRPNLVTALELKVNPSKLEAVQQEIQQIFGEGFRVKNRQEQQAAFMKVMKSESLFTFLVFALILGIATFTIMGSLSMMMLDKREHLRTLHAVGADLHQLRQVFFKEGLLISAFGAVAGVILGAGLVLLQQNFDIISLGQGYVIEAYPVELRLRDLFLVLLTVALLSGTASYLTSRRLGENILARKDL